jgi:heme/copper-type cytochrome/quinol oxidase subunit 2
MGLLAITNSNNGGGWVELIVSLSIFVPVVITIVIVVVFFRNARHDPDAQRLHQAQQDYEQAHRNNAG